MKPRYSISIPKPCHENWQEMTPNEKGRFCQSCSKTVVDFTNMKTNEVQKFIHDNKHQRICGHIRQSQLDTINLQISEGIFEQTLSFHKLFLLALLLAMGTSLLSCSDDKGKTKKIQSVEIVEKVIDSAQIIVKTKVDTSSTIYTSEEKIKTKPSKKLQTVTTYATDGLIIVGEVVAPKTNPIHPDSIVEPQHPEIIEGEIDIEKIPHCPGPERKSTDPYNYAEVEVPPMFKDTPENLDSVEKRDYFQHKLANFVDANFNIEPAADFAITGKQRIYVQFKIDKNGNLKDIKSRAPHPFFEKETERMIQLLPQFTPAKNKNQTVEIIYNLPIIFDIED